LGILVFQWERSQQEEALSGFAQELELWIQTVSPTVLVRRRSAVKTLEASFGYSEVVSQPLRCLVEVMESAEE
jgi:hypothetical protein